MRNNVINSFPFFFRICFTIINRSVCSNPFYQCISVTILINLIISSHRLVFIRLRLLVPFISSLFVLCIKENRIMCMLIDRLRFCTTKALIPNYFIHKIFLPKYLIHQHLNIMSHMPVNMDIDAAVVGKEFAHQYQAWVKHSQVADGAILPGVGIGELLDCGGLLADVGSDGSPVCGSPASSACIASRLSP